jgi:hypothetical protein
MRQYTKRKKITVRDVGHTATLHIKRVARPADEIDEQARKLIASGWTKPTKREPVDELEGAMTYTVYRGEKPKKAKPVDRDIVVVKRKRGERERHGKMFTHGKWVD